MQYMPWLERSGLLFALHCETPEINDAFLASLVQQQMNDPRCYSDSRPPISELIAVNTFAFLAKQYPKCRFYLVHASLAGSVDLSQAARAQGGQIYVETCPHYLAMTQQDLTRYGPFAVCNPPLRPKEEQDALWERMLAGKIDCIGSDHAPFLYAEKCQGKDRIWDAPPGFTGIQTCYPLLFQEAVQKRGMSVEQFDRSHQYKYGQAVRALSPKGQLDGRNGCGYHRFGSQPDLDGSQGRPFLQGALESLHWLGYLVQGGEHCCTGQCGL